MLMGFLFLLLEGESRVIGNKNYRENCIINIINQAQYSINFKPNNIKILFWKSVQASILI